MPQGSARKRRQGGEAGAWGAQQAFDLQQQQQQQLLLLQPQSQASKYGAASNQAPQAPNDGAAAQQPRATHYGAAPQQSPAPAPGKCWQWWCRGAAAWR